MSFKSGKNAIIYKGALEKEGLSEVAYYFKKAEHDIQYAIYALDGTSFTDALARTAAIKARLAALRRLSDEVAMEIDAANMSIYTQLQAEPTAEEE